MLLYRFAIVCVLYINWWNPFEYGERRAFSFQMVSLVTHHKASWCFFSIGSITEKEKICRAIIGYGIALVDQILLPSEHIYCVVRTHFICIFLLSLLLLWPLAKVLCVCSFSSWILNVENSINIFRNSQSRTADDPWNRRTKDETIKSEC